MSIIANFTTNRPDMAATRIAKDFYTFLGMKAENLGIAAKLYEKYTTSYYTEAFGNVIEGDKQSHDKFKPINYLMFEWECEMNEIKRIPFALTVEVDAAGIEIPMYFKEKYYEVNDTFMVDESHQVCIVVASPIMKAHDLWEYHVRLMDSDIAARLDLDACQAGMTTRWLGNVQPELSETGNVKYQSNYEKLRGWIGEIRCDITASSRYLALEDNFVRVAQEKGNGSKAYYFKMPGMDKVLLDNYMAARNNGMMWQKSTMDANGKCLIQDRQKRDLVAGDGIVPQITKYASKYNYSRFSLNVLTEAMQAMSLKAENPVGNVWAFTVNMPLYHQFQREAPAFLRDNKVDQQYLYSKIEGKNIKIGATYSAYEFAGNTIILHVDDALTQEYKQGFGILTDLTTDKASGLSPINAFTLKGKSFGQNVINGVATKAGEVSTPVEGMKKVVWGYWGVGVMVPYRSYVIMQN
jgi:hypothetical protein